MRSLKARAGYEIRTRASILARSRSTTITNPADEERSAVNLIKNSFGMCALPSVNYSGVEPELLLLISYLRGP